MSHKSTTVPLKLKIGKAKAETGEYPKRRSTTNMITIAISIFY